MISGEVSECVFCKEVVDVRLQRELPRRGDGQRQDVPTALDATRSDAGAGGSAASACLFLHTQAVILDRTGTAPHSLVRPPRDGVRVSASTRPAHN